MLCCYVPVYVVVIEVFTMQVERQLQASVIGWHYVNDIVGYFFTNIISIWICIISRVAVWPAVVRLFLRWSCVAKTLMLDITGKLFNQILSHSPCSSAQLIFYHFYTTYSVLGLGWGS